MTRTDKRLVLSICAALFSAAMSVGAGAQEKYGYPMEFRPISFSGTYGELRHNHFHSGVDWRTGGRTGEPLHAIKSGWICRLYVSTGGYGNGVYIQHPDGTMSVYGHLDRFRDDVARRVLQEQYDSRSWSVDFALQPDEFPLEQGEVFGYSGNTGSSGGPHLHMEIRREEGNLPVNYLAEGVYPVTDNTSPKICRVGIYAYQDSTGIPQTRRIRMINNPESFSETVPVSEMFYVAIDAVDFMEGTQAKLAVETYKVWIDDKKVYEFNIGNVPYSEGHYFACLIQNAERGADLVKTWCEPGNGLIRRIDAPEAGIICLEDDNRHFVRIEVKDCFGNSSDCRIAVRRSVNAGWIPAPASDAVPMLWYAPNIYINDNLSLSVPVAALPHSIYFTAERQPMIADSSNVVSPVWRLGDGSDLLLSPVTIRFNSDHVADSLRQYLYVAGVSGDNLYYAGGGQGDGFVEMTGHFGTYCLALDRESPRIFPNVTGGAKLPDNGRFLINVEDAGSGIGSYSVEWDGEWILCHLRGSRIQVFPDRRHKTASLHNVKVTAADRVGNSATLSFELFY